MESVVWRVSEFFFLSLGFGLCLFSFIANPKFTGAGFFKLIHACCLGFVIFASICFLTGRFSVNLQTGIYICTLLCLMAGLVSLSDKRTLFSWILFFVQSILFLFLLFLFSQKNWTPFFLLLTSSLMTGIVTYSMLLGHWYLVVFDLPIQLLKKAIVIFWVVLAVKLIISGTEVCNLFYNKSQITQSSFFMLVFLMRILWGYIITGVMSVFAWKLAKIHSTQSATGILYAMTFFVFVGEIISIYLFFRYGFFI